MAQARDKSSRNFDFNKPREHRFDFTKDEIGGDEMVGCTPNGDSTPTGKNKVKWYTAALAGLLVLGGGGYYLSQQGEETNQPVAEVVESPKTTDVVDGEAVGATPDEQTAAEASDGTADDVSNESAEDTTPASSEESNGDASQLNDDVDAPVDGTPVRNNPSTEGRVSQNNQMSMASVSGTVETEAREVIRGKYGNGAVRKRNLGDRYAEIQSKVNEMYRNGQVR